jgi:hypothetical protein
MPSVPASSTGVRNKLVARCVLGGAASLCHPPITLAALKSLSPWASQDLKSLLTCLTTVSYVTDLKLYGRVCIAIQWLSDIYRIPNQTERYFDFTGSTVSLHAYLMSESSSWDTTLLIAFVWLCVRLGPAPPTYRSSKQVLRLLTNVQRHFLDLYIFSMSDILNCAGWPGTEKVTSNGIASKSVPNEQRSELDPRRDDVCEVTTGERLHEL